MTFDSTAWTGKPSPAKWYLPEIKFRWVAGSSSWMFHVYPMTYNRQTTYTLKIRRHIGKFYDYRWVRDYDLFRCKAYPA